jgi:hypothetical protein
MNIPYTFRGYLFTVLKSYAFLIGQLWQFIDCGRKRARKPEVTLPNGSATIVSCSCLMQVSL